MTQVADRNGFPLHLGTRMAMSLVLGLGIGWGAGLGPTPRCEAAAIGNAITPFDRSRAVLLDGEGQPLPLPSAGHMPPAYPQGETPTYLAFPLYGGEHLSGGIPTLSAGPQQGLTTVGPLDFSSQLKADLNAALDASGMAVVDTPNRNYLVEFLPRVAALRSGTTMTPAAGSRPAGSNPTSALLHFFTNGSGQLVTWGKSGLTGLEKSLGIGNPKATATKPSLNLAVAAQELSPPPSAESSPRPLAEPVPEPGTWLVFGLILGAAGLRQRLRRRASRTV